MRIDIGKIDEFIATCRKESKEHRAILEEIVISNDPTPHDMKRCVAMLDAAYTPIRVTFARIKTLKGNLETFINVAEKTAFNGRNADERKANAALAATQYKIPVAEGQEPVVVNLYTKLDEVASIFNQYDALIDIIDGKHQRLILDSGIMKLESNLSQ